MKIGLYGGSFNPVHNGHLGVIDNVLQKNIVDEIWLLPCKNHAFDKDLVSLEHRVNMLKEATYGKERIHIDYTEAHSSGKNYTSETLKKLRKKHPEHSFYFIIGSDAVNDVDKWHNYTYLYDTTSFIVVKRTGYTMKNNPKLILETVIDDVSRFSSTEIRERISCGESIKGMLPASVERYILKSGLYRNVMEFQNPGSTVDLIVKVDGGLLFIKRKHAPFKGQWAFPGGYLECGKESLEEAGVRELYEETSLKANPNDLELLGVYSNPKRDPRGHVIAHAYVVKKFSGKMKANDDAAEVKVFKEKPESLAFDHSKIYDDYMKRYL